MVKKWIQCERCNTPTTNRIFCGDNCRLGVWKYMNKGYQYDLEHAVRSRWERTFAEFCIDNNINYKYEPECFDLGDVHYLPDFYLIDYDIWIEIKGKERIKDKEKHSLFRKTGRILIVLDSEYFHRNGKIKRRKEKKILGMLKS